MSETTAPAKIRRHSFIDQANGSVTVEGLEYHLEGIPPHVVTWLALDGLRGVILTGGNDAIDKLRNGKTPGRVKVEKELDPWRLASAHAIVEHTKKLPEPVSLDAAKVKATNMSREQLAAAKTDPLVVKHWRKVTGADHSVLDHLTASPEASAVTAADAEGE